MVGLDAAGKTTILYKLKLGEIVTTIPTIGVLGKNLLLLLELGLHNTGETWNTIGYDTMAINPVPLEVATSICHELYTLVAKCRYPFGYFL